VKVHTRTDKDQTLEGKVASVQALLVSAEPAAPGVRQGLGV
jgi:hypothetical protein